MSKKNKQKIVKNKTDQTSLLFSLKKFASKNALVITVFFATVINMLVLIDYQKSPYSQFLLWDAANYWKWALEIAGGNWIGNAVFHQPPLFPYLLSIFISIFGETLLPFYLFQSLISILTSVIVYLIGVKITNNKYLGIIAGLMFSFYGMQAFYTTKVLSECITIFLLSLSVRLLISGRILNSTVLAGIITGLLLLTKPQFLLAVPFIVGYYIISSDRKVNVIINKISLFLIPLVLIISPVTIRNYFVGKEFTLISSNGGENFYIGNNAKATGTYVSIEGVSSDISFQNADVIALAQSETGMKLNRSEVSKFFFKKGITFISAEPLKYLALEWRKLTAIFSGTERVNMYVMRFERENLTPAFGLAFVNFYILFPFFCIGVIAACRYWKKYYLIFLMLAINILNMLIFFYDTRFMVITMPFFVLLSATGFWFIVNQIKNTKQLNKLINTPSMLIFFVCSILTVAIYSRDRQIPPQDWRLWMSLGDIQYGISDYDKAIEYYLKASGLKRGECMPSFGVSKALYKKGYKDVAVQLYNSTYKTISSSDKITISRDSDFDSLREYAQIK